MVGRYVPDDSQENRCVFSRCRTYRYVLAKRLDHESKVGCILWIGLNPSTADESRPDPTLRRICGFSRSWGYAVVLLLNLFAFRTAKPRELRSQSAPVGSVNDHYLLFAAKTANTVMVCWGVHGFYLRRAQQVLDLLRNLPLFCLGTTANDHPLHPLYVPKTTQPQPYCRRCHSEPGS
jgi:hypothetical protein